MPVDRENGSPPYIVNPVWGNRNNLSRSLKIISRNQGWEPDVIVGTTSPEGKRYPDHNIANFNKEPDSFWHDTTGTLPQEIPANQNQFPDSKAPDLSEKITFSRPDVSRETKDRSTSGADPYPGGGWQNGD